MISEGFGGWVLQSSLAAGLLCILILMLRRPVARHFGPGWACVLWLLPALRLVLPPLPLSPLSFVATSAPPPTVVALPLTLDPITLAPQAVQEPAVMSLSWLWLLGLLWGAGILLYGGYLAVVHGRYLRALTTHAQPVSAALSARMDRLAGSMGLRRRPALIKVCDMSGPLLMGLIRPALVVPADFETRFTVSEQDFALRHELIHLKRGDLYWALLAVVLRVLHWPNPLIHLAYHQFRLDQELAVDAEILAHDGADRHTYGRALVKTAAGGIPATFCPMTASNSLKERLIMMNANTIKQKSKKAAAFSLATLMAVSLVGTASFSHPHEKKDKERIIFTDADVRLIQPDLEDSEQEVVILKRDGSEGFSDLEFAKKTYLFTGKSGETGQTRFVECEDDNTASYDETDENGETVWVVCVDDKLKSTLERLQKMKPRNPGLEIRDGIIKFNADQAFTFSNTFTSDNNIKTFISRQGLECGTPEDEALAESLLDDDENRVVVVCLENENRQVMDLVERLKKSEAERNKTHAFIFKDALETFRFRTQSKENKIEELRDRIQQLEEELDALEADKN